MPESTRANRGPSAAAENRAALITAARTIFATRGLDAPLSAVAREAGVGQGSLYRHFPTRASLAVAVFAQNVDALDALARRPGSTLEDILGAITDQAIVSTALIEMIDIERAGASGHDLAERIHSVIDYKLPDARERGTVPPWVTTDDVMLAIAMLSGALTKTAPADRTATAARIWALLPFGRA